MVDRGCSQALCSGRDGLQAGDPVMRSLIDVDPDLDPDAWRRAQPVERLFQALLFQIVGQQISVSALHAIYARLRALFPGGQPDPYILALMPINTLRRTDLSARKRARPSTPGISRGARPRGTSTGWPTSLTRRRGTGWFPSRVSVPGPRKGPCCRRSGGPTCSFPGTK